MKIFSKIKMKYIFTAIIVIAGLTNPCFALFHSHQKMKEKTEQELQQKQDELEKIVKDHEQDIKTINSKVKITEQDIKEIHALQVKTLPKIEAKQKELMQSLNVQSDCSCNDDKDIKIDSNIQHPFKDASIYVFVSHSMNEKNIIDLGKEAAKYRAHLVLRGFVDNSYIKTARIFQKFVEETGQGLSVDPELFKTFAVNRVPTFIVTQEYHLQNSDDNTPPMHDKLSGNVSLEYAIREFKAHGSITKQVNTKGTKVK